MNWWINKLLLHKFFILSPYISLYSHKGLFTFIVLFAGQTQYEHWGYSESYKPTLPNIREVRKVLLNGPTIMNKSNWLTVKQISWWNEMVVWLLGNQIVKHRATEVYWYALPWYLGNLAGYKLTQPHCEGNKV